MIVRSDLVQLLDILHLSTIDSQLFTAIDNRYSNIFSPERPDLRNTLFKEPPICANTPFVQSQHTNILNCLYQAVAFDLSLSSPPWSPHSPQPIHQNHPHLDRDTKRTAQKSPNLKTTSQDSQLTKKH
jgi:hypothetical protein